MQSVDLASTCTNRLAKLEAVELDFLSVSRILLCENFLISGFCCSRMLLNLDFLV